MTFILEHNFIYYKFECSITISGGMAIGIPGEIKGYHHAWMKYGRLPWKKLIEPSIELCKVGTIINKHASNYIVRLEEKIRNDPDIR